MKPALIAALLTVAVGRLVVDGCVLFVCRTQVWRRADTNRCPPVSTP